MYTFLISFGIFIVTGIVLPLLIVGSVNWTVLPAFAVGVAIFIWMSRRISKRFEAVNSAAEKELQSLQQLGQQMAQRPPNMRSPGQLGTRIDGVVEIYKSGFQLSRWQLGVSTMLNARIGMLLFSKPQIVPDTSYGECIPYLEKAAVKGKAAQLLSSLWPAWAMLGIAYYKKDKNDLARVRPVFEKALSNVKKEGMFWQIYAWLLAKEDQIDEAIAVLARAHEALPEDKAISENLTALQNRKKMQMKAYGDLWYQFGLDMPKIQMMPRMQHPRARISRKR